MASPSKTQLLNDVYTLLKKRYKLDPQPVRSTVLESVVYGICHEGTTREQANQALSRFKDQFFDWNEVRVSAVTEIEGVLADLPEPYARARRIRLFLRQLFRKTYGFTLEPLLKKPQKEAVKQLKEYEAFQSDHVVATVLLHAMGGHAIPIDGPVKRALVRLRIAEESQTEESLRGWLERAIPKNRGADLRDLLEELAHDTCVAGVPDCPRCELKKVCPTGQVRLNPPKAPVGKAKGRAPEPAAPAPKAQAPAPKAPPKPGSGPREAVAKMSAQAPTKKAQATPSNTPAAGAKAVKPTAAAAPKPAKLAPAPAPKTTKPVAAPKEKAPEKPKPKAAPAKAPQPTRKAVRGAAKPAKSTPPPAAKSKPPASGKSQQRRPKSQ